MRTVGQILKEEREKKFYTLEEIEKVTKIRKELLGALEADDYSKLPPPTFVQGFIKNYGKFLKLDTDKLLAIFRREFSDRKHPPRILESFANPLEKNKFHLTPAKFISLVVVFLIMAFFVYLWFEFRFLVGPPYLEVTEPTDQTSVSTTSVKVVGKADPEVKVAINNQQIQLDSSGNFHEEIKLGGSVNKLSITATSKFGQTTQIERIVFLKQ
ncbi:helix-turn-helix domain-containing protein [Candidatus Daviesbacteria bacterium]|nr:helix-turn-helix domain-containing protein [Candidatus Daviesbacteria bacterium]